MKRMTESEAIQHVFWLAMFVIAFVCMTIEYGMTLYKYLFG